MYIRGCDPELSQALQALPESNRQYSTAIQHDKMRLLFFTVALVLDTAAALPSLASGRDDPFSHWSPPGPDDGKIPTDSP